MRYEQIMATLIISLLAGTVGAYLVSSGHDPMKNAPTAAPSALTQSINSGKLRCGYIADDIGLSKKESTGALSGIWYELTEAIGAGAHLEIIWSPTTPETLVTDLQAHKFDALCTGLAPTLELAKTTRFSTPAYYRGGQPYGFVTLQAEGELNAFLSTSVQTLLAKGEIEPILKKFEPRPSPFQRVKSAYEP